MAAENKTTRTKAGVGAFVTKIADPKRRAEFQALVRLMEAASGEKAAIWGTSIVGFGTYHYRVQSRLLLKTAVGTLSPADLVELDQSLKPATP